jgi:hypothetical protein
LYYTKKQWRRLRICWWRYWFIHQRYIHSNNKNRCKRRIRIQLHDHEHRTTKRSCNAKQFQNTGKS